MMSEKITQTIDDEINSLLDLNYKRAAEVLTDHLEILHNMANALLAWETLDKFQIENLMKGEKIADPVIEDDEPEEEQQIIEIGDDSDGDAEQGSQPS